MRPEDDKTLNSDESRKWVGFQNLDVNEDIFRQVFMFSTIPIIIHDMEMNIMEVNHSAAEEFGFSRDELLKKKVVELHCKEELKHSAAVLKKMKQRNKMSVETRFQRKDGSIFFAEATPCKYLIGDTPVIHVYIQNITERKLTQNKLEESNTALKAKMAEVKVRSKQLESKNKELAQFAYIASHDLQEPLRTVINFVQLMQHQYKGRLDADADKYMQFIVEASTRMSLLIKGLLDYNLIGRKRELTMVNCNAVIATVKEDLHGIIVETGATVEVGELPEIKANATEMHLLFQNLIRNAIKFRDENRTPHIKITAQKGNHEWTISVNDNGIGIEKAHHERIFKIFQRLHGRNKYEGSGIGLAHCQKIVELHNGSISVDSQPGEGSTFNVCIPTL